LVLQRPGWPRPQAGAVVDLAGGVAAAQLGSQLLGSADEQRRELADGGHPRQDRAASGGQQHPQRLPLPATPRGRRPILAKRLAGGPDGVQRVALGATATGWLLGPANLQDAFAMLLQEPGKAGAEAARPLDRPAAAAGQLGLGEAEQPLLAGRISVGGGVGEHAAEVADGSCGEGVAVGIDADDAVDQLCQHGHAVVLLGGGGRGRRRLGAGHRAAEL